MTTMFTLGMLKNNLDCVLSDDSLWRSVCICACVCMCVCSRTSGGKSIKILPIQQHKYKMETLQ